MNTEPVPVWLRRGEGWKCVLVDWSYYPTVARLALGPDGDDSISLVDPHAQRVAA